MDTKPLEEIGLTRSEALVYLALADIGPSTTGAIVKKSGVTSSKIYNILDRLEKKGLAGHVVKTGVREFEAANPESILSYVEDKERRLRAEKEKAQKIVSVLKSKSSLRKDEQEVTIYKGFKGLETVFTHCLKEMESGSTIKVMGVPSRSARTNRFFIKWNKIRAKNNVKMKMKRSVITCT